MHTITLPLKQFVTALAWLKNHRKHKIASIETFMGVATIRCGPLVASVPCTGDLDGVIEFDAQVLRALLKSPPDGETIDISARAGRVWVGPISTLLSAQPEISTESKSFL